MDTHIKDILQKESDNTDRIYLFTQPSGEGWDAYGQSAVNLQSLVPEVAATLTEEIFPEIKTRLQHVSINYELTEKYELPLLCTLLGNDFIELSPKGIPDKNNNETDISFRFSE